jgi:hypothetical protein
MNVDINDLVGWVGLVLAVLALPPVWARLSALKTTLDARRRSASSSPFWLAEWEDGRQTVRFTNPTLIVAYDLSVGVNSTAAMPPLVRRLRYGEHVDVAAHIDPASSYDLSLTLRWKARGTDRRARLFEVWRWSKASREEHIHGKDISEVGFESLRARKAALDARRSAGWPA